MLGKSRSWLEAEPSRKRVKAYDSFLVRSNLAWLLDVASLVFSMIVVS